jgi:hypothetical protein
VAVDGGKVFARRRGVIQSFDASGAKLETIDCGADGGELRLTRLDDDEQHEFLVFQAWGGDLAAIDHDGKELWTYPAGDGIDDVGVADLDGDGRDETIVGYNGSTGLHAVDPQGKMLWKNQSIGNVWYVSAGRFTAPEAPQVVTTSAAGRVHVFDRGGKPGESFKVGLYANGLRTTPSSDAKPTLAVVTGSDDDGEAMILVNGEGDELWKTPLPGSSHVVSLAVDGEGQFAAVGMGGGIVYVVDLADGKIVGSLGGQGKLPHVALLTRPENSPLVLVADSRQLAAFELKPEEKGAAAQPSPTSDAAAP